MAMPLPPPCGSRKYYRLTPDGVQYLNEFTEAWQNASDTVNRILHDKEG